MKKKKLTAAEAAEAADRKWQDLKLFSKRIGVTLIGEHETFRNSFKKACEEVQEYQKIIIQFESLRFKSPYRF